MEHTASLPRAKSKGLGWCARRRAGRKISYRGILGNCQRWQSVVARYFQNIFQEGKLDKDSTCAKIAHVQQERGRKVKGSTSFYSAAELALTEYEKYRAIQDRLIESDFDREVEKLLTSKKRKL